MFLNTPIYSHLDNFTIDGIVCHETFDYIAVFIY